MKKFRGKIIYNPSGKAGEYSYWAANFYNGCSGDCSYCYCKKPPLNQVWSVKPTLKKSCINTNKAIDIFKKELNKNLISLQKHGLFFNFNSDPFLKESFNLNMCCIEYANFVKIPCKVLTKQTWWINDFFHKPEIENKYINFFFTLTGYDKLEPGCATNQQRIETMKILKERGFKTGASIEPVIDVDSSWEMMYKTFPFCDHYKIGIFSKEDQKKFLPDGKYNKKHLQIFTEKIIKSGYPVYLKDSILKECNFNREDLPSNCVGREYL